MIFFCKFAREIRFGAIMTITEALKQRVWEKGRGVEGFDPDMYRKDACGSWIIREKYGVTDNIYGWHIDHICPESRLASKGISESDIWDLRNLRPLQCQNNLSKSDDYPSYIAAVTSEGSKNVQKERNLTVNESVRNMLAQLYHL